MERGRSQDRRNVRLEEKSPTGFTGGAKPLSEEKRRRKADAYSIAAIVPFQVAIAFKDLSLAKRNGAAHARNTLVRPGTTVVPGQRARRPGIGA